MASDAVAITLGVMIPLVVLLLVLILLYLFVKRRKRQRRKFKEVSFRDNPVMTGKLPETPRNSDINNSKFVYDNNQHVFGDIVEEDEKETSFIIDKGISNDTDGVNGLSKVHSALNKENSENTINNGMSENDNNQLEKHSSGDTESTGVPKSRGNPVEEIQTEMKTHDKRDITSETELQCEENNTKTIAGVGGTNSDKAVPKHCNTDVISDKNDLIKDNGNESFAGQITKKNRISTNADNNKYDHESVCKNDQGSKITQSSISFRTENMEAKQAISNNCTVAMYDDNSNSDESYRESDGSIKYFEDVPL